LAPVFMDNAKEWLPPLNVGCDSVEIRESNLPDNYPGMNQDFLLGVNGSCVLYEIDNSSYWCQNYGRTPTLNGCFRYPSGVVIDPVEFANVNLSFSKLDAAHLVSWRGNGAWYTWTWNIKDYDVATGTFTFGRGGFQGGEGSDVGERWYLEGIPELLDAPNEFYYDASSKKLFYYSNTTVGTPPPDTYRFYGNKLEELFKVEGTQDNPVTDINFYGLTFSGTKRTELAPHGVPSGGDWAIEALAALHFKGVEGVNIVNCTFTRVDGNAVIVLGYARKVVIQDNDFNFVGNSAIIQWGETVYSDATGGTQPIGTLVQGNVINEIGIYQKQSSGYFQAKSCLNKITGNVMFNQPRAAVNFNDGMGGGSEHSWNLLFNTCRESSDHSSFNSWDRVPYITTYRYGRPSVEPISNEVHHNFHAGNYGAGGGGIDTDDGSSWYNVHHNFFVYGGHKSDFGGHGKLHFANLNAYSGVYGPTCCQIYEGLPHPTVDHHWDEGYFNNTCVLPAGADYFGIDGCESRIVKNATAFTMKMGFNKVYIQDRKTQIRCGDLTDVSAFLALGRDVGTEIYGATTSAQIIEWAKEILGG